MSHVDWLAVVPKDVRDSIHVDYSYLSEPANTDELEADVARIRIAQGFVVDIGWDEEHVHFVVTLSLHFYDKIIMQICTRDVSEVIDLVKTWATNYAHERVAYSDSNTTFVKRSFCESS